MRPFFIVLALVGCGDDAKPAIDAAVPDAPPTLDCSTYCTEMEAHCTGSNAQYPDMDPGMAHCMATCASFTVGNSTVTDMSSNTLGCRIYHGGTPSKIAPATHCIHAGPAGDLLMATPPAFCSGGDVCASFCTLEIKACGSVDAPLPGDPRDANGNLLFQYVNMSNCMASCAAFDKTHPYSITAAGDSLACRLFHATSAAIAVTPNATTECSTTGAVPRGPCAGAATP